MTSKLLEKISSGNALEAKSALDAFNSENVSGFCFPELEDEGRRRELWSKLFSLFGPGQDRGLAHNALTTIRILSRDRGKLPDEVTKARMETLLKLAGIEDYPFEDVTEVNVEALKCIYNIIFNMESVFFILYELGALKSMVLVLTDTNVTGLHFDYKIFVVRIAFLLTAHHEEARHQIGKELDGVNVLSNLLNEISDRIEETSELCREILRVLYNLLRSYDRTELTENERESLRNLITILRKVLSIKIDESSLNVISDVVNLFTLISEDYLVLLAVPGDANDKPKVDDPAFVTLYQLTQFLDMCVTQLEEGKLTHDRVLPVFVALTRITKAHPRFRKYFRTVVLPDLKELHHRPEEGKKIRNKLCRLLTSPRTHTTKLVANWLFILCKQNVGRMVKYTGYGNAAGLLAQHGLLGGKLDYSPDSEDSETEEYRAEKHLVNPVVGCVEPKRPNPLDSMSESEKEELAMSLVNDIDKLQRGGVLQPCRVGPDGKPVPIEHVLELQQDIHSDEDESD